MSASLSKSDLIRKLYAAFGAGDIGTVLGGFDPRIEWREAEGFYLASGNPYLGPAAVAEGVFGRIGADFAEFSVNPQSYAEGGDVVLVQGRYSGILRASGRKLDAQFAHVWTLRGGKVVSFQQYTDTRAWTEAKGD